MNGFTSLHRYTPVAALPVQIPGHADQHDECSPERLSGSGNDRVQSPGCSDYDVNSGQPRVACAAIGPRDIWPLPTQQEHSNDRQRVRHRALAERWLLQGLPQPCRTSVQGGARHERISVQLNAAKQSAPDVPRGTLSLCAPQIREVLALGARSLYSDTRTTVPVPATGEDGGISPHTAVYLDRGSSVPVGRDSGLAEKRR